MGVILCFDNTSLINIHSLLNIRTDYLHWYMQSCNITKGDQKSHLLFFPWILWKVSSLYQQYLNLSNIITVTSLWASWRLKSPASRLCTQPFVQAQIKANIKVPRHWSVRGAHRRPVNSPHKGPVTRKMFSFDDIIMMTHWVSPRNFCFHFNA